MRKRLTLYYQSWRNEGARLRLALSANRCDVETIALPWAADEIFFELGVGENPVILKTETKVYSDSLEVLQDFSAFCPENNLATVSAADWQGLKAWHSANALLLERLYAPVALAATTFRDEAARAHYKAIVERRFGQSVEALANDRYAAFQQFARQSQLSALSQHLEKNRFYNGHCSAADCWLTADLFPLQFLDGISLPIGLRYYWQRVMDFCACDLTSDWLVF
jgi:glutaredoxin 2